MTKEQYKCLLRQRKHEEYFVFMVLLMNRKYMYKPREMFEAGAFNKMPYKRLLYILKKFNSYGIYEYGVSVDLGWLTKPFQLK